MNEFHASAHNTLEANTASKSRQIGILLFMTAFTVAFVLVSHLVISVISQF